MTILATGMLFLAGCGGGGSDGPKPLDINAISGLVDSPKPVFAGDEDDTVESLTGTEFGVLTSAIGRVFGDNPGVSLPDSFNAHVASVTPTADGGIDAVFMVDGKAVPFSYSEQELEEGYPGDTKTVEGTEYSLGNFGVLSNQNPLDRKYFELA